MELWSRLVGARTLRRSAVCPSVCHILAAVCTPNSSSSSARVDLYMQFHCFTTDRLGEWAIRFVESRFRFIVNPEWSYYESEYGIGKSNMALIGVGLYLLSVDMTGNNSICRLHDASSIDLHQGNPG